MECANISDLRMALHNGYCAPRWPLDADSYVARSILQKAIRRGHTDIALAAAATLLDKDPQTFWRRMIVTAMEDLGIANVDLIADIAACNGKTARASIGNDWQIAAHLVARAGASTKCQAANDLYNIAVNEPETAVQRALSAKMPAVQLLQIACDHSLCVVQRSIAALAYLGVGYMPGSCGGDAATVARLFDGLAHLTSADVADTYLRAFKATRLALAPLSLILHCNNHGQIEDGLAFSDARASDQIEWIRGAPAFALDQYTRAGRATIEAYIQRGKDWRSFANANMLDRKNQLVAAGELLFRVEGTALDKRRNWVLGNHIGRRSRRVGCYLPRSAVDGGMQIITNDLPLINCIRRQVYRAAGVGTTA